MFSECLGFRVFWGVKVYCFLVLGFGLEFNVQVLGLGLGSGLAFKIPLYMPEVGVFYEGALVQALNLNPKP